MGKNGIHVIYIIPDYASLRKTSKGELRKTVWILLNPIKTTKIVIPGKKITNGIHEGANDSSKTNKAKLKLLIKAKTIPTKLPKSPKKMYSKAEIFKI